MTHVERKKIKGNYYLYQYQSYRDEGGRVRKRFIKYLGPDSASTYKPARSATKGGAQ